MMKQLIASAVIAASVIPAVASAGSFTLKNDGLLVVQVVDSRSGEKFDLLYGQERTFTKGADDPAPYEVSAKAISLSGNERHRFYVPGGDTNASATVTGGYFKATWHK